MFTYKMPTELFVGRGASAQLGAKVGEMGCSRVLLVTDGGVAGSGIIRKLEESLGAGGVPCAIFDEVEPEPTIQGVAKATSLAKEFKADAIVGVGGGSSMDSAKAVAVMATNPGEIFDYVGFGLVKKAPLPIIAIPTTSGTGSEATFWSVLCDKTRNIKASVGGWNLMPTLAVVDAELTMGLPPRITAATGMDALCHAMESYVAKSTQPISEGLSIAAMKLIARSLRKAVNRGDDIQAREDMILGSLIAALAFNITRLGNAHALAIPFGAHFGIPHGVVNAILLPWVMEYNLPAATEKYIEVARIFGENVDGLAPDEAAAKAVVAVKKLLADIGLAEGLAAWKVTEEALPKIAEEAVKSGNVPVNPRLTKVEDLIAIARNALNGITS